MEYDSMNRTNDSTARQTRYVELDSLRGLAALTVLLCHFHFLWVDDTHPASAIYQSFVAATYPLGAEAVILFFVLSGFVLSLPAINGKPQTYPTFITRRIFRIYVPFLVALAVSVAGASWLHGAVTRSGWFLLSWSEPVRLWLVVQHVLFLGNYDTFQFDNPIWSLVYEMRISIVFPWLCAFVLRLKSQWGCLLAVSFSIFSIEVARLFVEPNVRALAYTVGYAAFFVLGITLARERRSIAVWFNNLPGPARPTFGAVSLLIFAFAGPLFNYLTRRLIHQDIRSIIPWTSAVGACGLVIVSMNSRSLKSFLDWAPIHWLGEMSYSLYLLHFVVLLYCVHLLYGRIPLPAILLLSLIVGLVVSRVSYLYIEVPSMNLGRKLGNKFSRAPILAEVAAGSL
jgi:peptidoglycan/LPS O-acetylase OafA/YrhL